VAGQWWFNLKTQTVEEGEGDPNSERLGPYETRAEATGVLDRVRTRNEAIDTAEED
jgi:hypothetical protein